MRSSVFALFILATACAAAAPGGASPVGAAPGAVSPARPEANAPASAPVPGQSAAPTAAPTAAPAPTVAPAPTAALAEPLPCAGSFAQGGAVVCRGAPGARVTLDGAARGVADPQGWFVIGFDRDAPATAVLETTSRDGAAIRREISVSAREFSIQRVDGLPPETVTPSDPAVLARIARDRETKNKGFSSRAAATGFLDGFVWPVRGRMSGPWGNQRVLNGVPKSPHYGIDIAAPTGTPIVAPAGGVVALAEPDLHFEGGLVLLDHGQGLISMYLHMSRLDVRTGDRVAQGQSLGAVGRSGRTTGPHLCWRMKWRDRNLDPSLAIAGLGEARVAHGVGAKVAEGQPPQGFTQWRRP